MIELKNIKLNKFGIDILNDISFNIEDKKVTCILGNKNSGKSSLLKIIAGVYKNYYGEVLYDANDIKDIKSIEIDLLPETRENDENITVFEYLMFYGTIYKKYKEDELEQKINEMLKKFSLMSYKYTSINLLDNTNYKIIELIRILINDPKVILFDNLFSGDNVELNEKLFEYIKKLIGHKTLVFVSRSLNYIEEIVDYIGIIDNGSMVVYGKKEDVYQKAELSNRIEVELLDGREEAVEILKKNENVANIVYDENLISFSIISDIAYSEKRNELESLILKELVNNGIKVYSFKKRRARFEQLFERLKE